MTREAMSRTRRDQAMNLAPASWSMNPKKLVTANLPQKREKDVDFFDVDGLAIVTLFLRPSSVTFEGPPSEKATYCAVVGLFY